MLKPPEKKQPHDRGKPPVTQWDYVKVLLGGAAIVGFLTLLAVKHPSDYGIIPPCPFHTSTGFYCPGCGSMRATHFLMNGDMMASLHSNPLVLAVLPLLIFSAVRLLSEMFFRQEIPFPGQTAIYWTILIVLLVFFVARNIPLELFDVLRPPISNSFTSVN